MSASEILILEIVQEHGGALPYHQLAAELRNRFQHALADAVSFGRRSARDTVYELGALGALTLDERERDDPRLSLTEFGRELLAQPNAA